jgi:hypothetical protein
VSRDTCLSLKAGWLLPYSQGRFWKGRRRNSKYDVCAKKRKVGVSWEKEGAD